MSETPSHVPVKYIMPKWIRGPQDFVGGLAMVAIALFALWASSDLCPRRRSPVEHPQQQRAAQCHRRTEVEGCG